MKTLRRFYNWLFRVKAYEQYRVKAIIKVGRNKFKVRAKDYAEFVKIICNAKEGRAPTNNPIRVGENDSNGASKNTTKKLEGGKN